MMFKGLDRWLIGIIILVAVVVVVTLVLVLTRSEPEYLAEVAPEAVVHNYLLALQREEYDRALTYLSSTLSGLPADSREMRRALAYSTGVLERSAFRASPAVPDEGDIVRVEVNLTSFEGAGLLDSRQETRHYTFWLRPEGDTWKLIDAGGFWGWSWD
jgi:hypothetical protein